MTGARVRAVALAVILGSLLATAVWAEPPGQPQKPERKVVVTGAVAEIDEPHHTVSFTGGAKLTTNEGAITSREMEARVGANNVIESAEARREVKLDFHYTGKDGVERIMTASANQAIYRASDRTVQLTGSVTGEIREPASQRTLNMAAEEVTFWVDESRLRLRPAQLVFTEPQTKQPAPPTAKQ